MTTVNVNLLALARQRKEVEEIKAKVDKLYAEHVQAAANELKIAQTAMAEMENDIKVTAMQAYGETGETGHPAIGYVNAKKFVITDEKSFIMAAASFGEYDFLTINAKLAKQQKPEWAAKWYEEQDAPYIRLSGLDAMLEAVDENAE